MTGRQMWLAMGLALVLCGSSRAQVVPWDTFADDLSDSVCDLVNASNAELVVSRTGKLVIVSGTDVTLEDSFVDVDGTVFFAGLLDPVGFIGFALDGDGFRTLWWTSLTGRVIGIDDLTADPFVSDQFPSDFSDVPCDACPFWDDPTVCALPPEPPVSIDLCGTNIPIAIGVVMAGLMFLRLSRSRRA